mmetsp:Transcript_29766/g.49787  ORF Transcript_29766/g.49787 Transcript_29766/m.49787 type:complete len:947 (-) Transcript_29766:278-3118(-)
MSSDVGRITRKIKQGKVDIDFEDYALLVNYDLEMIQVDDNGMVLGVLERKPEVRRIKIKSLSADKNMAQLAADIVDKCKYIHPSRVEEIEQLLIQLRKHSMANAGGPPHHPQQAFGERENGGGGRDSGHGTRGGRDSGSHHGHSSNAADGNSGGHHDGGHGGSGNVEHGKDYYDNRAAAAARARSPAPSAETLLPPADMADLDDYLDMLYQVSGKSDKEKEQGLRLQERGTGMILKLCRDVMNLEQLIQNGTVMGALTRVLQEEYKKSVDLTFNIIRIFLAFSNFTEMHSLMANYKIGALTMKVLDFEVKRSEIREAERQGREDEFEQELSRAKKTDLASYPTVLEKVRRKREKEAIKHRATIRKQDKLLFVGFYILLNIAEDLSVERKMVKKQLIPSLAFTLNRRFEDLLILCVTFLKKLSTIGENKETMKEMGVLDNLIRFIPCSSQPLITITLRMLFNLSFDSDLRDLMLKGGIVPKLVNLLKVPVFRAKTLKLLYHLSVDDRCKSMITYTDGVPILMGLVINFPQDYLARELAALMVNISYNSRNVELMINNKGLNLLMDRLADKRDPLLLKLIRNISQWTFNQQEELEAPEMQYKYRGLWSPHIKVLMEIVMEEDGHDLLVEVFGCLANMTIYDLPASSNWSKLLREYNLLNLFCKMLVPGMAQNDLLLEIVMLISTIASDMQACSLIASSTLIGLLYQLWEEKCDDTELLLQLIHCFYKLFLHDASREEAMYSTRIVVDIIECLNHRSGAVQRKAALMCELVLEFDRNQEGDIGNLGMKILQKKFESFNKQWVTAMSEEYGGGYQSEGTYLGGGGGGGGQQHYHHQEQQQQQQYGQPYYDDEHMMQQQHSLQHNYSMETTAAGVIHSDFNSTGGAVRQQSHDDDEDGHGVGNGINLVGNTQFFNDKVHNSAIEWKLDDQVYAGSSNDHNDPGDWNGNHYK